MDYSYGKQMDMWNATNYPAQVEQLNKAGLNPALEYGMKGGGGVTTGSPTTGVQGGAAGNIGMGIESGMNPQAAATSQTSIT